MTKPAHRQNRLEIRIRETLLPDGTRSSHSTVFCPRDKRSTAVIDCFRCQRYSEFALGKAGSGMLRCRAGHDPAKGGEPQIPKKGPPDHRGSLHLLAERTLVSALVASRVRCVDPDVRVETLASALIDGTLSGSFPVVDERGIPIGMVLTSDVRRHDRRVSDVSPLTVREIMWPVTLTLDGCVSVSRALTRMIVGAVHRVPVVDSRGSVVGVLSVLDILRWLRPSPPTRTDG